MTHIIILLFLSIFVLPFALAEDKAGIGPSNYEKKLVEQPASAETYLFKNLPRMRLLTALEDHFSDSGLKIYKSPSSIKVRRHSLVFSEVPVHFVMRHLFPNEHFLGNAPKELSFLVELDDTRLVPFKSIVSISLRSGHVNFRGFTNQDINIEDVQFTFEQLGIPQTRFSSCQSAVK